MTDGSVFSKSDAPAAVVPAPAATVVVLRDRADGPEVLLLQRHQKSRFMAGAFVFPGGRVDPADAEAAVSDDDRLWCHQQLFPTQNERKPDDVAAATAYYVAAVRELFEEAGILLARPRHGTGQVPADDAQDQRLNDARQRLNANEVTFSAILEAEQLEADVRALVYWSQWITPAAERRRYDTRFFVAWLPDGQTAVYDDIETTQQVWMTPARALMAHHQFRFFLAPPQQRTLEELLPYADRNDLVREAQVSMPAPVLPKLVVDAEGIRIVLPWDARYADEPGDGQVATPGARQAAGPTRILVRRPVSADDAEDRAPAILRFWFGDDGDGFTVDAEVNKRWWRGGPTFDEACRAFAADHQRAIDGGLDDWRLEPQRDLARILLLDQFSRNLGRNTPAAFAQDAQAQQWVIAGLDRGHDRQLPPVMRAFYYMPLVHAEDRALQNRQLTLFDALVAEVPEAVRALFENFAKSGKQHQVIVDRFGRFPHRNEVLGRVSTPEEIAFLEEPGSRF